MSSRASLVRGYIIRNRNLEPVAEPDGFTAVERSVLY